MELCTQSILITQALRNIIRASAWANLAAHKRAVHTVSLIMDMKKKAERIRQEAHREILPAPKEERKASKSIGGFQNDDILLGILIFFLVKEEKADMMLIMALVFILLN